MSLMLHQVPDDFVPFSGSGAFCEANGPIYVRPSDATLGFRVRAEHCNPVQSCHGGWLAAFIDMQMPYAAVRNEKLRDTFLLTICLSLDYLAPATVGDWIEGTASVLRRTGSLVFAQGLVMSSGTALLRGSGVYKIARREPFTRPDQGSR
jgi:uncharacterized protein (TIGR00369 family)